MWTYQLQDFLIKPKAWFTLRHKNKHKHKHKQNECSHLLHKHKESDIRKRNELQNEAVGVWDEARFQNGGRRNSPSAFAALQMPDTFLPTIFLSRLHLFLRLVNAHLPVLTQKVSFIRHLEIIWAGICRRGRDNCQLSRQVSRRKQYSQMRFWAVLTWISAGIKHSCFLEIMLMLKLHPVYTLILAT